MFLFATKKRTNVNKHHERHYLVRGEGAVRKMSKKKARAVTVHRFQKSLQGMGPAILDPNLCTASDTYLDLGTTSDTYLTLGSTSY